MSSTPEDQIEQLKNAIAGMEAQRGTLGDAVVDAALAPMLRRLEELTALLVAKEVQPADEPAQQRKLVTLLFADIAGSTAIAQHMDPEDVGEIYDTTLKKLAAPVEAHGGRVTRFMGDGFLSVFGAAIAREDDPEQAVRAGLQIIEISREFAPGLQEQWNIPDFQVRVGINTGLVLLGGETEAEDTLMGAAVNLAARLESAAPPGGLLVSHDTYRHIRGVFDVEPLEAISAKGFDEPVKVYKVLRARPRAFRLYTRGVEGVETRMVGREAELKYLQDALLTAIEEGEGQVITITGEAGVGKSRLLYEFQDWIELLPPPHVRFFEGCARHETQGLPYALLRNLFTFRFQIQEDEPAKIVRQKLVDGLMEVLGTEKDGEEHTHILGQLLGFDFSTSPHLKGVLIDAEQLHNRGVKYLEEYFNRLCSQQPVLVMLEDIHWADDSSLDALNWLSERLYNQPLLVVCATRPTIFERRPYWGEGLPFHYRLNIEPLSRRESRQLVMEIFKLADRLPNKLRELVVEGAEGNPFYLEELVKMLVEGNVVIKTEGTWHIHPERLAEIKVPATLAGVLQARLDSIPIEERTVLQQASVVGSLFWDRTVTYIHAAGDGQEDIVPKVLASLRSMEMIYRREASAFADAHEYIFKNDILREVTYESVLKRLRRVYHGLVADWLIAQDVEHVIEYSSLIAGHLLQAGRVDQAIDYLVRAGESALASYANKEAEAHFNKAWEFSTNKSQHAACLAGLGKSSGRQGRTNEADQTLRQAISLYHEMGEYDQMAHLYAFLARVLWHDDHQKAWNACQEGLDLMENKIDSPGYARLLHEASRVSFISNLPERSKPLCLRAIRMAEAVGDLEVVADAKITLALQENDLVRSKSILEEVIELAESNGMLEIASRAHHNLGFILENLKDLYASINHTMRAIDIGKQISANYIHGIGNLIESYIHLGKIDAADNLLTEEIPQTNAPLSEQEIQTMVNRGRILYARGEWNLAMKEVQKSLDILHHGGSLSFIGNRNLELAIIILELNRFGVSDNLLEAEKALREYLAIGGNKFEACCLLSIIFARQRRFQDAYDRLSQAGDAPRIQTHGLESTTKTQAEFELALVETRWGAAVSICKTYIDTFKNHGYRWEWARRLIDLGDALVGRDGPGDREQAQDVYKQSLEMFTEMEAPGYIQVLEQRMGG